MTTKADVKAFFETYTRLYNDGLAGKVDLNELASVYSSAFVSVTPQGVMAGDNDDEFKTMMKQGYARYRDIGSRTMSLKDVSTTSIDQTHLMAKVEWSGEFERKDTSRVTIEFAITYFLEQRGGALKVFGWIAGDEQAEFRKHGLL